MASPTTQSKKIRANKKTNAGKNRKRAIRRAARIQSEDRLEQALGERISLPTCR
jgi:hypothetical protein